MNIFISYTLRDEEVTFDYLKAVSNIVSEYGQPFVDVFDNQATDKQKFVMDTLDSSDLVVLISTSSITKSQWVQTEVDRAKKNKTPIVRIYLTSSYDNSLKNLKNELDAVAPKANKRFKMDSQRSAVLV